MNDSSYGFAMDEDAIAACANLVARTGATGFEIGYTHEGVPVHQAGWYAHAQYRGARLTASDAVGPVEAAEALCRRLLRGAQCQHCRGLVTLSDHGAVAYDSTLTDGRKFTVNDALKAGVCRWRRYGPRWERGCVDRVKPNPLIKEKNS